MTIVSVPGEALAARTASHSEQSHLNAVYINNILRATYAFYNLAHHAEIIPILPVFDKEIGNFETAQLPHIIERGEAEMEAKVEYLKKLLLSTEDQS
jgi:hypothetical protein